MGAEGVGALVRLLQGKTFHFVSNLDEQLLIILIKELSAYQCTFFFDKYTTTVCHNSLSKENIKEYKNGLAIIELED